MHPQPRILQCCRPLFIAGRYFPTKFPSRKAAAMASGTSASAKTTPARLRATWAFISCSRAVAIARRSSAFARATRVSASA